MADPAAQAGDAMQVGDAMQFRRIETLGQLVGRYCWVEHRIFEMTGAWASDSRDADSRDAGSRDADSRDVDSRDAIDAERRVWCAATSRRHGALSARWYDRLPVRAGIERAGLIVAPAGPFPGLLDELASAADPWDGLAGLVGVVLPGLSQTYTAHLTCASAVNEAPVMEVLVEARREGLRDIQGGLALLQTVQRITKGAGYGASKSAFDVGNIAERAFDEFGIFPAVPPS